MTTLPHLTRRAFSLGFSALSFSAAGAAVTDPAWAAETALTPRIMVDRIKTQCAAQGVQWASETVDTFKLGDPDNPITGIISTFMATLELLQKAAAANASFIISHEPVFYGHFDRTAPFEADPVYQAKVRYAIDHGLTVWRFHDHWHKLKPEPMSTALIARLGWEQYQDQEKAGFSRRFTRPPITLSALVEEMAERIPSHSIRLVGDSDLLVTKIGNIGHTIGGLIEAFHDCDVAIAPEVREWDCVEYTRDAMALGQKKAVILIAHERGEEAGMERCAQWLMPLAGKIPVRYIPSGEPFRSL